MKISGIWLAHSGTRRVMAALSAQGHRALYVGGCVRNALLGAPVADIDIATDATPSQASALAKAAGLKVVPTGFEHGTITVIAEGVPHEVTTFRRDVETDGRHATVAFSTRIEEDAARRDFTMNALYAEADGTLVDPLGGYPDLEARRLRFVGEAAARIREDYLRILRFFRFHAWYGDVEAGLDPEALAAISENAEGLDQISKERIGHEMRKLLAARDPVPALAAMSAAGVLQRILPGTDIRAIGPLVHLEGALPPSWLRRLAALGGADPSEALRLSRQEHRALHEIGTALGLSPSEGAYRLGAERARDAALILAASLGTPLAEDWQAPIERAAAAVFPVASKDLSESVQGRELGLALKRLEADWIASDFSLTRAELLARL